MLLITGTRPGVPLPGLVFENSHAIGADYRANRLSVLTGQYPQRGATTRVDDILADLEIIELEEITECPPLDQVVCCAELTGRFSIYWPGVAESGVCNELTSLIDIAPTLIAIAGGDVRPNSPLSFDGLNLVPVMRHGASGHGALFFDDGRVLGPHGYLDQARAADEWGFWQQMIAQQGPLM
ncbi:hypothetical protein QP027_10525 [Corynebacterium breve]|uniref:Uncharacterized protein n=1 Tax=Corynebacterium breve TaxID=3049799 RepID=A0ABY8VIY2_9CORY|nr:hypothetical protein [Corynebacterium breve]WIM67520.1 hypothetical protein QP027_10525 [Corynebacterium breve]